MPFWPDSFHFVPPHLALLALGGVLLDRLLGEPRRWHPLVGFGTLANKVESVLRRKAEPGHPLLTRIVGVFAWLVLLLPFTALAWWLIQLLPAQLGWSAHALLLWFALGAQSLSEHAKAIAAPLCNHDLPAARKAISRIVSRDTSALDEVAVAKAGVESVLENGNDAVFGALFWFAILGGPGALMFRLANTLDAMWGYRTPRLLYFGWAAARTDDVLNYVPARLTALTYAALGHCGQALHCWRTQAPTWDSPNAGPVMAAGAGALNVELGGTAVYHGQLEARPILGAGDPPTAIDIERAMQLMQRGIWVWLLAFALLEIVYA